MLSRKSLAKIITGCCLLLAMSVANSAFIIPVANQSSDWVPKDDLIVLMDTAFMEEAFASWNNNPDVVRRLRPAIKGWSAQPVGSADPAQSLVAFESALRARLEGHLGKLIFHAAAMQTAGGARAAIAQARYAPLLVMTMTAFERAKLGGIDVGWKGGSEWDIKLLARAHDGTTTLVWHAKARDVRLNPDNCMNDAYRTCAQAFVSLLIGRLQTEGLLK